MGVSMSGLSLAAMGVLANQLGSWIDINPGYGNGMIALGLGLAAYDVYANHQGKYQRLFEMCGLKNTAGQVPVVIKNNRKNNTLVVHMPDGICQTDFEKHQQELEQALNCKIELGFNKNLIINLYPNNLKSEYQYEFEEQESPLAVYLGMSHKGKYILDIAKAPHIICSGETGSGKSTLLNVIAMNLIFNKYDIDLKLMDFQALTLGKFEHCRKVSFFGETIDDFKRLMDELEEESNRRIKLFRSVKNKVYIEKLKQWNELYPDKSLPHIVVLIDEYACIANDEKLFDVFCQRIFQDRKAGIHYIMSVARPDVSVVPGKIKAMAPVRIALKCMSKKDSEVIIDESGAEKIKHLGRCLIKYMGEMTEVQGLYIDSKYIDKLLKKRKAYKTRNEMELEKRAEMKKLRDKCINPYLKEAAK